MAVSKKLRTFLGRKSSFLKRLRELQRSPSEVLATDHRSSESVENYLLNPERAPISTLNPEITPQLLTSKKDPVFGESLKAQAAAYDDQARERNEKQQIRDELKQRQTGPNIRESLRSTVKWSVPADAATQEIRSSKTRKVPPHRATTGEPPSKRRKGEVFGAERDGDGQSSSQMPQGDIRPRRSKTTPPSGRRETAEESLMPQQNGEEGNTSTRTRNAGPPPTQAPAAPGEREAVEEGSDARRGGEGETSASTQMPDIELPTTHPDSLGKKRGQMGEDFWPQQFGDGEEIADGWDNDPVASPISVGGHSSFCLPLSDCESSATSVCHASRSALSVGRLHRGAVEHVPRKRFLAPTAKLCRSKRERFSTASPPLIPLHVTAWTRLSDLFEPWQKALCQTTPTSSKNAGSRITTMPQLGNLPSA